MKRDFLDLIVPELVNAQLKEQGRCSPVIIKAVIEISLEWQRRVTLRQIAHYRLQENDIAGAHKIVEMIPLSDVDIRNRIFHDIVQKLCKNGETEQAAKIAENISNQELRELALSKK